MHASTLRTDSSGLTRCRLVQQWPSWYCNLQLLVIRKHSSSTPLRTHADRAVSSACPAQGWPGPPHPNCFPSLPPIQPVPLPGPVTFGTFWPLPDPRRALALALALVTSCLSLRPHHLRTKYHLHVLFCPSIQTSLCAGAADTHRSCPLASLALAHQRLTFHIHDLLPPDSPPSIYIYSHPCRSTHTPPLSLFTSPLLAPSVFGHPMEEYVCVYSHRSTPFSTCLHVPIKFIHDGMHLCIARCYTCAVSHTSSILSHLHPPYPNFCTNRVVVQAQMRCRVPAKLLVITRAHANSIPLSSPLLA